MTNASAKANPAATREPPANSTTSTLSPRSIATRDKLLEGARKAFEENGYHATRIIDITENAGVALGNFYRHFSSKNEIFTAVLMPAIEAMLTSSGRSDHEAPARDIETLAARNVQYIQHFAAHSKLFRAGYEAAASVTSDHFMQTWRGLTEKFNARTCRWLASLVRTGTLPEDTNIEFTAEALCAMNENVVYVRIVRSRTAPTDAEIHSLAQMLAEIWWSALFKGGNHQTNQ